MEQQMVIFELSDECYGVNIAAVESIIKMPAIRGVPHAPSYVQGIINLRGKVLPVIDLRQRFGLPSRLETRDSRIVVVNLDEAGVGMMVDSVSEVLTIQDADIEPAPRLVTTVDSAFITGIAKLENRLVILLDLVMILTPQELKVLQSLPAEV
jgi:purine-binding chemotaxis protein CheW